ncbi:MAG: hypothetical protein AAB848_00075 [Patescibacteria group bacterium]
MKKTRIGIFALTVLLVLVIVGGCAWGKKTAVLHIDDDYKFKLVTSADIEECFSVSRVEPAGTSINSLREYNVYAMLSSTWGDMPWFYYHVISQEEYDKYSSDEPPGKPKIVLTLDSGELLVMWDPQDGPIDQPEKCGLGLITAEKI